MSVTHYLDYPQVRCRLDKCEPVAYLVYTSACKAEMFCLISLYIYIYMYPTPHA